MEGVDKDNYLHVLKSEFDAEDGSFLLTLRSDLRWDETAYSRVLHAMKTCCAEQVGDQMIERWLAEGFWYISQFVKDWTTHEAFPRVHPNEYYEKAYEDLWWLADRFFEGEANT